MVLVDHMNTVQVYSLGYSTSTAHFLRPPIQARMNSTGRLCAMKIIKLEPGVCAVCTVFTVNTVYTVHV